MFRIEDGHAQERVVEVGRRSGLDAEVLSGLAAGDTVVVHPDDRVASGTRVEAL